jgi:hypothetical protein
MNMKLFASLGLGPPKHFASAGRVVVDTSAVSAQQADLKAAMRDSIAYASQLKQPVANTTARDWDASRVLSCGSKARTRAALFATWVTARGVTRPA